MSTGLITLLLAQMLYLSSSILEEFCSDLKLLYSLNIEDDSFQKEHGLLEVADNFQQLVGHPCDLKVALYIREMVFFTRDGFQSSLYPLKFPRAFKERNALLTAAVFVEDHVVMLVGGNVYIYYPNNKSWTPAKGITVKIDGISTNQCCISKDSFCKAISSLVIAYHKSVKIAEVSIFLSTNGGLDFEEMKLEMPSKGIFEGAFILPTISALSLLIRDNQKFYFRYFAVHSSFISSPFTLNFGDSEPSFIQQVGLKGYIVIWNKHSLFFSPNHGQTVYPFHYYSIPGREDSFLDENRFIHQVITGDDEEIAVLTSDGHIYFGNLNIDAVIMKGSIKDLTSVPLGLLFFDKFNDLTIVEPRSGYFYGIFDFLHCEIWIEQELTEYRQFLKPCMVQWFYSFYQGAVHYIDMNEDFFLLVVYVPKSGDDGLFTIVMTDPFIVSLQAIIEQLAKTIELNKVVLMNIFANLFPVSRKGNYDFMDRIFPSELIALTVDMVRKDVLCRGMPAITTFLIIGCPPAKEIRISKRVTACSKGLLDPSELQNNYTYVIKKEFYDPSFSFNSKTAEEDLIVQYDYDLLGCPVAAHYASAWSPVLQLWHGGQFLEVVEVEHVMFEVNGINDYSYQLHLYDINCISEVQNWTFMLSQQTNPDPHTAWNSRNFHSCLEPGPPPTASNFAEYQILGGGFKNQILFSKRNGIYVFKAIVVNPQYSFCDLTTTFSVFVYGAQPETLYSSEMLLGIFILILIVMIFVGFLFR